MINLLYFLLMDKTMRLFFLLGKPINVMLFLSLYLDITCLVLSTLNYIMSMIRGRCPSLVFLLDE